MAGILTHAQMSSLEAIRRVNLVLQGEPESISLQKFDTVTGSFVDFLTVEKSFYPFFNRDAEGRALPPDVQFELRIGELMITDEQAKQVAAVQYGSQRFRVVRGDQAEPGILGPIGPKRFWRFHIAALEETP